MSSFFFLKKTILFKTRGLFIFFFGFPRFMLFSLLILISICCWLLILLNFIFLKKSKFFFLACKNEPKGLFSFVVCLKVLDLKCFILLELIQRFMSEGLREDVFRRSISNPACLGFKIFCSFVLHLLTLYIRNSQHSCQYIES